MGFFFVLQISMKGKYFSRDIISYNRLGKKCGFFSPKDFCRLFKKWAKLKSSNKTVDLLLWIKKFLCFYFHPLEISNQNFYFGLFYNTTSKEDGKWNYCFFTEQSKTFFQKILQKYLLFPDILYAVCFLVVRNTLRHHSYIL